ncbi:MAG: enoyl-CoA hydratase [Gammaproteobacteria bacterium]
MSDELVRIERDGRVALLTLNRPERRNAMNRDLAQSLVDAVAACQDAGAIVLTGAGPAFCAGLDLKNLGVERLFEMPPFIFCVRDSQVPVIGAVNGAAVTGGFELALACDFLIGSEKAAFADTHVRVGVFPGPVLLDLPRRIGMARAREMSMTGNFVDAQTALRIGILNQLVPQADLLPRALALARDIAEGDPKLIRLMRQAWKATTDVPFGDAQRVYDEYSRLAGGEEKRGSDIAARREAVIHRAHDQRPR